MPELGSFDGRIEAAIHAFADRADTRVDAAAVASRVIGRRRIASYVLAGVGIPASLILLLALLLALLAWSAQVGAPWDRRLSVVPLPIATPPAVPAATPDPVTPAPARTPRPATDGQGDEYVIGTATFRVVAPGTSNWKYQLRGFVTASDQTMNDPRVTGTGTLRLSVDPSGAVLKEWGTFRLENAAGAWEGTVTGVSWTGTVTGSTWTGGNPSELTGWLVGSGAYEGWSCFYHVRTFGTGNQVDGIIFPGAPPGS
ncbi:MAG: hypothetical protein L3K06_07730 [Thermoplasmata archaeon]|nr:hypothetical protein [Thermoplasmata archaeon]